jgi:hypothetical protein
MKEILLLAFTTGIAITVCAQRPDHSKSIKTNQNKSVYAQFIDIKGNNLKSTQTNEYRLDSVLYTMWNPNDSTWVTNNLDKYNYYPNGKQHWFNNWYWGNSEEKWIASFRTESLYDEDGRLDSEIRTNWNESLAQWTNALKSEYFYDENGNDTLFQNSNWNTTTSDWYASQRYESIFDDNGYKTHELLLLWNIDNQRWDSAMSKDFFNGENGRDTMHFIKYWDDNESIWILQNKVNTYYDENGNDTLHYYFNNMTSQSDTATWAKYVKGINVFDENGRKTQESSYTWDDGLNDWTGGYMNGYTYDEHGNAILIDQYEWDRDKSEWFIGSKLNQYFSEFSISKVPGIPEQAIFLFPNPAREFIYFNGSDLSKASLVEIYDIQGKKIMEQKIPDSKRVSVANLSRGLYIYKIHNNGSIYSGKILKE